MATLRRLHLLACLLATLLLTGAALPDAALWQCRHAARVVNALGAALSPVMPCRLGTPMPGMACCPAPPPAKTAFRTRQGVLRPACQPTLVRLTLLPAPGLPGARVLLRRSLLSAKAVLPLPAALLPSVPFVCARLPRPPPGVPLCASAPACAPGLRAPPAA